MRLVVVFVALTVTACVTVSPRTSVNVGHSDTTLRRQAAAFDLGIYIPLENKYVVNPFAGGLRTPLGDKGDTRSEAVNEWGVRAFTASDKWRNGYYGFGSYSQGPSRPEKKNDTNGVTIGAGLSLSKAATEEVLGGNSRGSRWALAMGSAQLGVVYHHAHQAIGTGDFIGVELTLVAGVNVATVLDVLGPDRK